MDFKIEALHIGPCRKTSRIFIGSGNRQKPGPNEERLNQIKLMNDEGEQAEVFVSECDIIAEASVGIIFVSSIIFFVLFIFLESYTRSE